MKFISESGEHLWAGQWGHVLTSLAFVLTLISAFGFASEHPNHRRLARQTLFIHALSVWAMAGVLIYMLFARYFEYQYVWQHSNRSMDMKYVLSCLWEGQEGSFLLWICWNALLMVLYSQGKNSVNDKEKNYSLSILALLQSFLLTMILGVYAGTYRVGSSPFLLLKEHPDFMNLPFLMNDRYLDNLDGRGLNPLLMNYWMVIHPPVLFLGFSLSAFPFAQILARLLTGFKEGWHGKVLPWVWASAAVLGAGILMGGAWAYESLSFGGFWAWDPVENASLVPWMALVAGGHLLFIDKKRNMGFLAGVLITCMAFVFVLYSTFLTRSGILGTASVHSFTDLGMQAQLLVFLFFFIAIISVFVIPPEGLWARWAYVIGVLYSFLFGVLYEHPRWAVLSFVILSAIAWFFAARIRSADNAGIRNVQSASREYQMFLGAWIFFILSLLIIALTSLPVINQLSGSSFAMPRPVDYTFMAIPFVIPALLLMGFSQTFKYKHTPTSWWLKKNLTPVAASLVISLSAGLPLLFTGYTGGLSLSQKIWLWGLFFSAVYAITANISISKPHTLLHISSLASVLSHVGFGLIVLGALISVSKKTVLSKNLSGTDLKSLGKDYNNETAALLRQGDTTLLGPYKAIYRGKKREGMNVYFEVDFYRQNNGKDSDKFTLYPKVQDHPRMGKAADPDTKHYWNKDIYTYVSYADLSISDRNPTQQKFGEPKNFIAHLKDTLSLENCLLIPDSLYHEKNTPSDDTILRVFMAMRVLMPDGTVHQVKPFLEIRNRSLFSDFHNDSTGGIMVNFWKINPSDASFEFLIREDQSRKKDFIVLEALMFPGINILWLGCLLMTAGLLFGFASRYGVKNKKKEN